jgi:acid phosphatase (class A)
MGALGANNLNLNLNLSALTAHAPDGVGRVRFNSSDYRKRLDFSKDVVGNPIDTGLRFPAHWDANLRSYVYLDEFLHEANTNPAWKGDWVAHLLTLPSLQTPPYNLTRSDFIPQILGIIDRAADRDDRFAEIIDQNDADGAINYWLGMLMIDPGRHPATYLLVRVAARIGEMVVMRLKDVWMCPRPSVYCPGIVPMIDPPATPSFPAGHALQARLISKVLDYLDTNRKAPRVPRLAQPQLLFDLADRIGDNRVVAGIHFPMDLIAGKDAADECFDLLKTCVGFQALVTEAATE